MHNSKPLRLLRKSLTHDSAIRVRNHIFNSVVTLQAALDGEDRTALMRRVVRQYE
jgi:hypothetical protein